MKHDIKNYILRFKNPILKEAITKIINEDIFAAGPIMMLAYMSKKACGWVMGGSYEFAKRIEQKYLSLGGIVNYQSKVKKINVVNNRAVGVCLENGILFSGDYILSCADGYDTLYRMLDGKYLNPLIKSAYTTWKLIPSTIHISLGIKESYKNLPPMVQYCFSNTIQIDPKSSTDTLSVRIFNFDPLMAPKECVSISLMVPADFDYWSGLRKKDLQEYNEQKDRVGKTIIEALNKKLPGIKEKIEVIDIATPATYERYNNIWKGAWEGFYPNSKQKQKRLPSTLTGLNNFWLAGQWVVPGGGLPTALMEGIRVCNEICNARQRDSWNEVLSI